MKNKQILLLIIIMTTALISLLVVQGFWIRNAFSLKEKQFELNVNTAITQLANQLETDEAVSLVTDKMIKIVNDSGLVTNFIHVESNNSMQFDTDTTHIPVHVHSLSDTSHHYKNFTKEEYKDLLDKSITNNELFVESIINQLLVPKGDISARINKKDLEEKLSTALKNHDITLPFEYAVLSGNSYNITSDKFQEKYLGKNYQTKLFPNDIFSEENYLIVHFSNTEDIFKTSTWRMSALSVILIIIIILGFSFAIYTVFKQKKLSDIKNDFINNMTHELKTPISTISLATQMLKDSAFDKSTKNITRYSNIIDTENKRLHKQVEKVLQMAVFDSGNVEFMKQEVDIHNIICESINNNQLQINNKNGKILSSLKATKTIINGDRTHLLNSLNNLIDNGIKYAKEQPEIEVSTKNNESGIIISVKDNGIGINSDYQKKIFDRFYRVPTGNVHDVKGFGLGLSYVKTVVDEHGGKISLESETCVGSTFTIYLPY